MFAADKIKDLTPAEVEAALAAGRILLVDVREPAEFAAERISGASNAPLSTFDPGKLPMVEGHEIVFQCGSGKRSADAVERCRRAGYRADAHLAGGIAAWKAAGRPTIRG